MKPLSTERGDETKLVDFGLSYGECVGYCTTVLAVANNELELMRLSDDESDPELRFRGTVDETVARRIQRAATATDRDGLEPIYGSPDAHDEGAATILFVRHTVVSEHRYSATAPPEALAELHIVLSDITVAWIECEQIEGVTFDECPQSARAAPV